MSQPGITFGAGITLGHGITLGATGSGANSYSTWSGLAAGDNPHGWTTQQYGANTVSIPWQWGGYNMSKSRPTVGQTVSDGLGHTATIQSVTDNPGASGDNLLIYLTSSQPAWAAVTTLDIV